MVYPEQTLVSKGLVDSVVACRSFLLHCTHMTSEAGNRANSDWSLCRDLIFFYHSRERICFTGEGFFEFVRLLRVHKEGQNLMTRRTTM